MRKNILKVSAIALLSTFALASCSDDIVAKPQAYDDNSPVVTVTGYTGTIYNNNFKDIYDQYRDGNLAQDVLNELLYQYSISVFGNYNKVTAKKDSEEITLNAAVNSYYAKNLFSARFRAQIRPSAQSHYIITVAILHNYCISFTLFASSFI